MDHYHAAVEVLRMASLLAGSLAIFIGILRATPEVLSTRDRGRVARRIGEHASLGLEFFVAATILNLVLNLTWLAVAATAFTIAIRQLLTLTLRSVARNA